MYSLNLRHPPSCSLNYLQEDCDIVLHLERFYCLAIRNQVKLLLIYSVLTVSLLAVNQSVIL